MTLRVEHTILAGAWSQAEINAALKAAGAALNAVEHDTPVELSIAFADDDRVQDLNRDYRGQDKPTNVLSFENDGLTDGGASLLGDVVLARETLLREASEQGKSVLDHLSHLTVHGVLHLLGYDHEIEDDAVEMEAFEIDILGDLGIDNPYTVEEMAEEATGLARAEA